MKLSADQSVGVAAVLRLEGGDSRMAQRVAAYVREAGGRRSSNATRDSAFRCVLDLLGSAAAGIHEPGSRSVRETALQCFGKGGSPIWFTGRSGSVIGAAWANSASAAALDLDDGHRLARGHPGAAVIPAVLAVAGEMCSSVEEIVTAIAVGYEVGVAIAAARTSYGNTGTWSSFAVVAAAAALRRTAQDAIEHALAIAGESGPNQLFASAPPQAAAPPEGSDVKEGIPWSVVTGLVALGLAENGHTGPRNILDSAAHYRFAEPESLGRAAHIRNVYFKLYACCRHIHAPLDACLRLQSVHRIDASAIDRIEVETYSGALRISNKPEPGNLTDIQYSIPYCIALALLHGSESLLPLTKESLGQLHVVQLARKVALTLDPALDARFPSETLARVRVHVRGHMFESDVTAPQGEATQPLTPSELESKVRGAMRLVAGREVQDQLLNAVCSFRAADLQPLHEVLGDMVLGLAA